MTSFFRRPGWLGAPAFLAFATLALLTTGAGFVEDEIQCDHAAAHLEDCCPALDPTPLRCTHVTGCGGVADEPWLTEVESECVRHLDCGEIREAGICERVVERVEQLRAAEAAPLDDPDADVLASDLEEVCP